jgi:hypothetical protein
MTLNSHLNTLKSTEAKLYYAPKAQKLHQLLIEAKERIDRTTLSA